MPDELWNAVGALLIATAMLATHPIRPAVGQRIESQIAMNWSESAHDVCTGNVPCLVPFPIQ